MSTPAVEARHAAGYIGTSGLKRLARRMGYTTRTVRHYELNGGASDDFCRRWSRHVGAPARLVFYSPEYFRAGTPQGTAESPVPVVRLRLQADFRKRTPTRPGVKQRLQPQAAKPQKHLSFVS
jgi:hypothetical protein